MGHLNFIVAEEEEETEFQDALGEHDEYTRNLGQVMDVSLCALSEALAKKTILIQGLLKTRKVLILIDT